ncbi:hypothetical protein AY599_23645 [Leptolyngbya valderiana BDU 20041]|nr:hypothetical protein AY599_23645 [Leptolyngbya valderiana BDU 20041]
MAEQDRDILAECAGESATDIGNGRRFRRRHGDLALPGTFRAIRVAHIGWHVFDGRRWREDQEDYMIRPLAHETAERIGDEARLIQPDPEEEALIEGGKAAERTLADMEAERGGEKPKAGDMFGQMRRDLQKAIELGEEARAQVTARRRVRWKWGRDSQASGKLTAMLTEAAPYITRLVDDLNTDRLAVNVGNGTIRFRPGERDGERRWRAELHPHDQADMITKLAPARWYPSGDAGQGWADDHPGFGEVPDDYRLGAPEFEAFLETVLPDDIARFLQRFFGYCLLGLTTEQVLLFFYGAGRNGKSTFMDAICRVLGDYAVTLAIESFSGEATRGGGDATPDLARLPGARLVAASEPEAGAKLKEALIKMLTGGEKFPVRRLRKEFFEIDPQFKMVISGNHKPIVTDDSDGTWRRLLLVPWDVQIPKDQVDVTLPQKLRAETDGIMAWLVAGALSYLENGLAVPDAVTNASRDYREESNPIEGFIRAACDVTGEQAHVETSRALYDAYREWCRRTGGFEYAPHVFARRFPNQAGRPFTAPDDTMKAFSKSKSNGVSVYRGIMIRPDFMPAADRPAKYGEDE